MMTRTTNRQARRFKGVVMIEFLIVLPICMMLVMATAEFGRAFMQYNALTKGLRDGARHVASNALVGTTGVINISGATQAEAQNLVVYGNTSGSGAPILPGLTTGAIAVANAGAGNIRISATYPYGSIFAFVPGFFYSGNTTTNGYNLQAAITMRAL